jgi:DNA recombination-dependent growth factor C
MGYFRDITSGQSLEDVDISVHCDVTIFEWLMEWVKRQNKDVNIIVDDDCEEKDPEDDAVIIEDKDPELSPSNVVSILVSASFLKMGPLVDLALKYLHQNMNKVLVTTHNLNCLGEPLLTR